jgi:hypothetical protein|tara:strand:- start:300 stop:476 length:177 start_codon:yes stop_codon:yes gene_type:complete
MSNKEEAHLKPLYRRPRDWWEDLIDLEKPILTGGLKNPLAWILSIIISTIIIYLRDFS